MSEKTKPMSRTIICPKCMEFAVIIERRDVGPPDHFHYIVNCERDGKFNLTSLEERKARMEYTRRMKKLAEAG